MCWQIDRRCRFQRPAPVGSVWGFRNVLRCSVISAARGKKAQRRNTALALPILSRLLSRSSRGGADWPTNRAEMKIAGCGPEAKNTSQ
jgi:hypothetical protein